MGPPAAEARALADRATIGALATITDEGLPWASLVADALLGDGSPVLCLSRLAEHGRNLELDPHASLLIAEPAPGDDPLDSGRCTLAGRAERPAGAEAGAARAAFLARVPSAATYVDFDDFALWVLRVERVRWVGGYGRMGSGQAPAAYIDAMTSAYFSAIGLRLSFIVVVSSSPQRSQWPSTMTNFLICSTRA